ncbi:unnamed protein product [Phytophthora fragariaefolia]|uniref:Unnamed protein product n=1 Tax=Phytophthora fragariaefolia TaxID=1490495 RepID=A0A9W7D5A9_9STRA|nr:unnamed protein product [Phytophthora fragariaefolia]
MSFDEFGEALQAGELAEVVVIRPEEELNSSSLLDEAVLEDANKALNARVRHEIDLVPETKYCVTRQWPLPREQCDVIDAFFCTKHEAGLVRESKSPHSTPTLCVRKPNGKWRIVHAFNKLNAATIPAQTPIPRKEVLQNNMVGSGYAPRAFERASDVQSPGDAAVQAPQGIRSDCMRTNQLYANIDKCIFGAEEIPFLGCFIGKRGLRADPAKVKAIVEWPVPRNQKDLRKWLGLANYLHKYSENYAEMARPLSNLLKKDAEWRWNAEHQDAFEAIKDSLLHAPILALPDPDRPFSVVCDASDFAIGCALLQADAEGRERVIAFESRQLKAAEKNYPVHAKELLAMKYALVKFRVQLFGSKPFVIYTDHASLRTAPQSPHLSQRMARWLCFFAEYNFEVKYKPGKQDALADALSRRPDYELAHVTTVTLSIPDLIRASYASDDMCVALLKALGSKEFDDSDKALSARLRARLHRYAFDGGLLYYSTGSDDPPRVVDPHDDDLNKMARLAAMPDTIDGEGTASLFLDRVFRQHGLPEAVVSDRDPRFTGNAWTSIFAVLGTRLDMSTADHPQTDGQTERVNRVVEDVLRSICAETPKRWSAMLPLVQFALNNAVHVSTGYTPFYVNGLSHPHVPLTPLRPGSGLSGGEELAERLADINPLAIRKQVDTFLSTRLCVLRHVRYAMVESQDKQKNYADAKGRSNVNCYEVGDLVLLNAKNLPTHAVSVVFKTKLRPRFIGPFKVAAKKGLAYTLNLP